MKKLFTAFALVAALVLCPVAAAQSITPAWNDSTAAIDAVGSTTTGTYPSSTGVSLKGASAALVHVVSASTSSATVLIQGSVDGTFWYTLATISNPTSAGELWAGPAPAKLRVNLSVHASGTISAFYTYRQMASDPIGHEWKKVNQAANSFGALSVTSLTDSGLTVTRVPYSDTGGLLKDDAAFTFTTSGGILDVTALRASGLTATRVPFAGASGLLGDNSAFTFTSGTGALAATSFVGAFNGSTVTSSTLTSGRCALTSTAGLLIDSSAALCTASLFTLPSLKVSDLTATRVPFAGAAGLLDDDAAFTFTVGTGALGATSFVGAFNGGSVTSSTLTNTRMLFAGASGLISDVANFTYNSTTGALTATNGTAPSISTQRFLSTGTAPAVANVGSNSCGTTAATIAGKDQAFVITVGETSGTECRVTFNVAFANAPVCTFTGQTATDIHAVTTTTTTTVTGTLTAGEKIMGICLGY